MLACVMVSLLGLPTKAVAEPTNIINPTHIKVYAFQKVLDRWGSEQWDAFDKLVDRESKWESNAQNPNSTAYGLGQLLNSTWDTVGCKKTDIPEEQINCTIKYIEQRYKTPKQALQFHYSNNWY